MNDNLFQWSLMILTAIAVLWMVLGSVFGILGVTWIIIIGLIAWVIGGGALLYLWGKNYMSRM
ncbi:MAG TPA: hypothetical protein VF366_09705 [Dehalococcoidia bacterium]|jgi:5-bromo-4-chloroindolyl phosphate hydrolysis protein